MPYHATFYTQEKEVNLDVNDKRALKKMVKAFKKKNIWHADAGSTQAFMDLSQFHTLIYREIQPPVETQTDA